MEQSSRYQRPPTTQEAVLAELRRMLAEGELAPGSKLAQDSIATALQVSRHPVREALKVLEGEGQVTYTAQRGYRVATLDPADLQEIYRLRSLLEDEATTLALPRLSSVDFGRMEAAQMGIRAAMEAGDLAALVAENRRFHFLLLTPCGMPRLMRLVGQLWDASAIYRARHFAEPSHQSQSFREHHLMLQAARDADISRLLELSEAHRAHAVPALEGAMDSP